MQKEALLAVLTLALGLWAYAVAGWPAAGWLTVAAGLLVALAEVDARTGRLPNELTLPLLGVGLVVAPVGLAVGFGNCVVGAVLGATVALVVIGASAKWLGKPGWGMGDMKLLAALGAWVGATGLLPVILLASWLAVGWIFGMRIVAGRRVRRVAFGPFLAAGGWLTLLYQALFWRLAWEWGL
jgi:leader peptidase (prepilin peptidase)/N-methyltransferase